MIEYSQLKNNQPCPHCGRYKNRTLAVDVLIASNNGILLIKRNAQPDAGLWALPGGHVDFDETMDETVIREVMEETGLTVIKSKLMKIYSQPKRNPNQNIAAAYIVKTTGRPFAGSDASDINYFPFDKLPLPLAFDHEEIITHYSKLRNKV